MSRAYFAAFAAIVHELEQRRVTFPIGRFGPSHQNVPELIRRNLRGLTRSRRKKLLAVVNELYARRIDADYRPPHTVDRSTAINSVASASFVVGLFGVAA